MHRTEQRAAPVLRWLAQKRPLMVFLTLVVFAGFLAAGLISHHVARSSMRDRIIESELPLTSDNIYSEIQRDLLQPIFISSLMANDTFLRDWALEGERDVDRIIRYLASIREKYETVTSFFISDRTQTYYHADGILKKISPEEPRDVWYYRVRGMDAPYEINVDPDLANKDALTIFINYRVLDYDGDFLGATGVGLTVGAVKSLIESYRERYRRNIYFTDQSGRIVLHAQDFDLAGDNIRRVDGLAAIADDVLDTDQESFTYRRDGKEYLLNVRYIPELDWHLLVDQPADQAYGVMRNILLVNLAILVVIAGVVAGLTRIALSGYERGMARLADTDNLTGLANRQAFEQLLRRHLGRRRADGPPLAVVLFDIDHFKQVNDAHGHLAGDMVLQRIADLAREATGEDSVVCRWGGEEFLVLLPGIGHGRAFELAERLRDSVEGSKTRFEGREIVVTLSLGVAEHRSGETAEQLFARVDAALYTAKREGRNRTAMEAA